MGGMKGVLLLWVLMPVVAGAQEELLAPRPEEFGALVAPAALPAGALAVWGWSGLPEVGVGFRQGVGGWELGAQARVDWVRMGLAVQGGLRRQVYARGGFALAPRLEVGLVGATGARYLGEALRVVELEGVLARVEPGVVVSWRAVETVALVGQLTAPLDFSLSAPGSRRLQALGGAGVEAYVGQGVTVLALGELGVEGVRPPGGRTQVGLGYAVRLGVGWRLF